MSKPDTVNATAVVPVGPSGGAVDVFGTFQNLLLKQTKKGCKSAAAHQIDERSKEYLVLTVLFWGYL